MISQKTAQEIADLHREIKNVEDHLSSNGHKLRCSLSFGSTCAFYIPAETVTPIFELVLSHYKAKLRAANARAFREASAGDDAEQEARP